MVGKSREQPHLNIITEKEVASDVVYQELFATNGVLIERYC